MRLCVLLIFIQLAFTVWSQPIEIRQDLRDQWKVLTADGTLTGYNRQAVHTIHVLITDEFKGGIITITSPVEFTLFIDGRFMVRTKSTYHIRADSLLLSGGTPLMSIHQQSQVKSIKMELIKKGFAKNENELRASSFFSDFVIISSLFLFGFFVILFRSNTRLTIDYLNLAKVFSFQEREEAIVTGRIGSSINILFFVFISLLCGLLLVIIFNNGPLMLRKLKIETISGAFGWWIVITSFILIILVAKLALVWGMSILFGFKGVVRFQFFNFIRSMYASSAIMALVMLGYFVLEIENSDFLYFVLVADCSFIMLSTLFLYFKLLPRTSSSVFHLFSYLCGSEIISLMILFKVLLN